MDVKGRANWESAAASWQHRPPISPAPEDMAWYEQAARGGWVTNSPLRALLLGVTAEIATMDWPVRTNLVAVDWAEAMIKRVWQLLVGWSMLRGHIPRRLRSLPRLISSVRLYG